MNKPQYLNLLGFFIYSVVIAVDSLIRINGGDLTEVEPRPKRTRPDIALR